VRPRLIAVTLILIMAGAVAGAVCGVLALVPAWIATRLHPTPDDVYLVWSELAAWAALVGSIVGAVAGPTLALSLLRRAPLWRVVVEPLAGAIVGAAIGWTTAYTRVGVRVEALAICALLGALCAAVRLRRSASPRHGTIAVPLPNER
jgi:hypothetical protein